MFLKSLFACASLLALGAFCSSAPAQSIPLTFTGTLAGGGTVCSTSIPVYAYGGVAGGSYGDGCPATQATLNVPVAVTADQYGNVFIADQTYQLVRVVYNGGAALAAAITASNILTPNIVPQKGYIYTIAGGETKNTGATYCNQAAGTGSKGINSGQDSCAGTETEQGPRGLAVDADGNLFIASVSPSSEIRVFYVGGTAAANLIKLENPTITAPQAGYVYLIAGANSSAYSGDNALASKAALNTPRGISVDANENVYFADNFNFAIRRVDSTTGFISTVAGHNAGSATSCSTATSTGDSGSATATTAIVACPYGVAFDTNGNLFIAEAGNGGTVPGKVRVVYAAGTLPGITSPVVGNIYTYAGGASGTTQAQLATFQEVFGISLDPAGALYVTDYRTASNGSNRVWRVDPASGNIATIAGNSGTAALTTGAYCNGGSSGPKTTDTRGDGCPATQAYLNLPQESFTWTPGGTFYIADRGNNVVRSFSFNNLFPATAVGSNVTQPLAFLYAAGALPTTETFTNQGVTSTDYSDAGGDTCALNTTLAASTTCVVYVKFFPAAAGGRPGSINVSGATGTIATQTLVGIGTGPVLAIDPGTTATLGSGLSATAISNDELGNVYVSDATSKSVLKGTTTLTTFTQLTDAPGQTATDPYGDVFVADPGSNKITEVIATAKGGGTTTFGTGLSGPQGVATDQLGNIYIADTGNNRLLYLSPATGNQIPFPVSGFTLSAPSSLATDAAGDLFIVDSGNSRVLEVPMGSSPVVVALPSGTVPTGLSLDPAGDLYITDKTTASLLYVPAGTTTSTGLVTGLKTPVAVAVSPTGSIYVADSGATSIITDNRTVNTSVFPTTNVQLTSLPVTLTLENVGNAAATLSTPPFVETGTATAFPASSASTTCAAAGVIAPAGNCTQSFVFQPTTPGPQSAKAIFSTTTGQSVTANFSATATNLILTTTTLKLSNTGTIYYGQPANYTVTVTPASTGSSTPTGNIAVVVDGKTTTTVPVASSPYSFQLALAVGTHSVAATYTGDAIYAASNTTTTITIVKATTTTTVASSQTAAGTVLTATVTPISTGASPMTGTVTFYVDGAVATSAPVGTGTVSVTVLVADGSHTFYAVYAGDGNYSGSQSTTQSLVVTRTPTTTTITITPVANGTGSAFALAAKVTSTGTGTPSGTVTFSNNGTTLGIVNLSTAVNGIVTLTTGTTTYTSYMFTATYSGDGLFQPSSGSATEGAGFVVVPPSGGLTVLAGGQAASTVYPALPGQTATLATSLLIYSLQGYSGTLTGACTGMPVNSLCRFTPATFTLASGGATSPALEVITSVNPNVASVAPSSRSSCTETVLAIALLAPLAFVFRRRRGAMPGLCAVAVMVMLASLTGCGNKTPAYSTGIYATPVGVYTPTIVVTDTNGVSNSSTFTLTVLPPLNQ